MNWHHTYWWTGPAGIVLGVAVSYVIWCVIPPRFPPPWRRRRLPRADVTVAEPTAEALHAAVRQMEAQGGGVIKLGPGHYDMTEGRQ
jgi:hypothetical protein